MQLEEHSDTEERVREWGRWVMAGGVSLGANSVFKLGSTIATAMITDDDALVIDSIVARLNKRAPDMGSVICKYYTTNMTEQDVAKKLGKSRGTVSSLRNSGIMWIDGVLLSMENHK